MVSRLPSVLFAIACILGSIFPVIAIHYLGTRTVPRAVAAPCIRDCETGVADPSRHLIEAVDASLPLSCAPGSDASPRPPGPGGPLEHLLDQIGNRAADTAAGTRVGPPEEPEPDQRLDFMIEQLDRHDE